MAKPCNCSATCNCLVQGDGVYTTVTGAGTVTSPYVIHGAPAALSLGADTTFIDLSLTGSGTQASPWILTATMLPFSLNNLSNVNITGTPTNGYVLAYNASTSKWLPAPPSTATPGAMHVSSGISGDGSSGSPLVTRLLSGGRLRFSGSDQDITLDTYARLNLIYANAAARTAQYSTWGISPAAGHTAWMSDTQQLAIYNGTGWVLITPEAGMTWEFDRVSGNQQDQWVGLAGMIAGTITGALPGRYMIFFCCNVASADAAVHAAVMNLLLNSVQVDGIQADLDPTTLAPNGIWTTQIWAGGTMNLAVQYTAASGTGRIATAGSRIIVVYMGKQ